MEKEKYLKLLENKYEEWRLNSLMRGLDECDLNKYEFAGDEIFGFITQDSIFTIVTSQIMLEVLDVLINKTHYEYIKNADSYAKYLMMLNMPFLKDKITWGKSIKGAWLDDDTKIHKILGTNIEFLTTFIKTLLKWVNE